MTNEVRLYLARLEQMRQSVREVLLGLAEDGLNWKPLPEGTNSIYNLAQHAAWVEQWQIGHGVGGRPFPYDWSKGQDLNGYGEDAADLLVWLDEAATATTAVLANVTAEEIDGVTIIDDNGRDREVEVRWLIVHTIEHYAEHIGQMLLTRQLWKAQSDVTRAGC